jgi:hypothetical protein
MKFLVLKNLELEKFKLKAKIKPWLVIEMKKIAIYKILLVTK